MCHLRVPLRGPGPRVGHPAMNWGRATQGRHERCQCGDRAKSVVEWKFMLRYDEQSLVDQLSKLPQTSRVMFAAACAERLRPLYRRFNEASGQGSPDQLD